MLPDKKLGLFLQQLIARSIKWPMVFITLGALLIALSLIDDAFHLSGWNNWFDIANTLGDIFIASALAMLVYNLLIGLSKWFESYYNTRYPIACLIVANLQKGLRLLLILVMLNIIITIATPSGRYLHIANNAITITIILAIGWIIIQALHTIESGYMQYMITMTHAEHQRVKALYTKLRIIRNILTVIIVVACMAAILMSFESVRDLGISLLASAGFITAILGLSAQKALFSLFSGVQIALAQPIKIGDMVVIEGESGIVEEITFTYVTLKLGDRRRMMVPINFFVEKPFENWSHEGDSLRSSFSIFVDYFLPIEPLRKELQTILDQSPLWDQKASKLHVANLTERSVEIRIQVSAENPDNLSDLRAEVREKMLSFIRETYPDCFPKMRLGSEPH